MRISTGREQYTNKHYKLIKFLSELKNSFTSSGMRRRDALRRRYINLGSDMYLIKRK